MATFGLGMRAAVTGPGATPAGVSIGTPTAGVPANLAAVTNLINSLNLTAQAKANAARIPNATGLEEISSGNIASELRGELSPDVIRFLEQSAAERGVGGGYGGSPNEVAAYLRALGLTSLDLQKTGQANLSAALARNPAAPVYQPDNLITTPYQQSQLAQQAAALALDRDRFNLDVWKAQQANNYAYQENQAKYGPKQYSYAYLNAYGAGGLPNIGARPEYIYNYWR